MWLERVKREKLRWLWAVKNHGICLIIRGKVERIHQYYTEDTANMDREWCVRAVGVECMNINSSTGCTASYASSIPISVNRTVENSIESLIDERNRPISVCTVGGHRQF